MICPYCLHLTVPLTPESLTVIHREVANFCKDMAFEEALSEKVCLSVSHASTELIRLGSYVDEVQEFAVRISYRNEAVVAELIYDKKIPLSPIPEPSEDSRAPDVAGKRVAMDRLWIDVVKELMDRVSFKIDGPRRIVEMREYQRPKGKARQHWVMGLAPKLRSEVKVDLAKDSAGEIVSAVAHNVDNGNVLIFDAGGAFIITRLDGKRTCYEIYMEYTEKSSLTSPERVAMVFKYLERNGMLEQESGAQEKRHISSRFAAKLNNVLFRSLTFPDADLLTDRLYKNVRFLFHPLGLLLIALVAVSGFYPLLLEISELHELISKPILAICANPIVIIELYVFMTLVMVLHELAHGLVCKHFGGRVERMGIMFYVAMIIFFTDVSGAWAFKSRWKRVAVAAGGPVLNLFVMSCCFWIWYFSKGTVPPEHSIWFLGGFFCLFETFINFIPLIKMDGYYMLADLTGMPMLRERSFEYWAQIVTSLAGLKRRPSQDWNTKGRERLLYLLYGVMASAFTLLFIAYPIVEFVRIIAMRHSPMALVIFLGLVVALTIYNATYRAYRMVHAQFHTEIPIT
ncbi:site-2 protease family protein [Thermodesulfobacteriota bacterium]